MDVRLSRAITKKPLKRYLPSCARSSNRFSTFDSSPAIGSIGRAIDIGTRLMRGGTIVAAARPPQVTAIDATGAGDCFVAALTLALLEGQLPDRALRFACAAGALAATRAGAQPSLPMRAEVDLVVGAA